MISTGPSRLCSEFKDTTIEDRLFNVFTPLEGSSGRYTHVNYKGIKTLRLIIDYQMYPRYYNVLVMHYLYYHNNYDQIFE